MSALIHTDSSIWSLAGTVGYNHPLLVFTKEPIIHTWIVLSILVIVLGTFRLIMARKKNIWAFMPIACVDFFYALCEQSLTNSSIYHITFIATLFLFIAACNTLSIIPWLEEPTQNINTTLALAIISFCYAQGAAIQVRGLKSYIFDYFSPFFIMFPLNVIGKLASVVSLSFRLFGNVFGGYIIKNIYVGALSMSWKYQILGIITGLNLCITLFFGLFEGLLQAYVFTMLSLTYLALAIQGEGEH